jgi:hypothetical protein
VSDDAVFNDIDTSATLYEHDRRVRPVDPANVCGAALIPFDWDGPDYEVVPFEPANLSAHERVGGVWLDGWDCGAPIWQCRPVDRSEVGYIGRRDAVIYAVIGLPHWDDPTVVGLNALAGVCCVYCCEDLVSGQVRAVEAGTVTGYGTVYRCEPGSGCMDEADG